MGVAAAGTAGAWAFFAARPPMQVLVGTRPIDVWVPVHYQASAFPAFLTFTAALGLDAVNGRARGTLLPRAALVGVTGLLSTLRLGGALPLSGHAVFLSAALTYSVAGPRADDATPGGGGAAAALLSAGGLAVTAWYKLAAWGDGGWLGASALVGAAIGGACASWARARTRASPLFT
jgi:hypothetical protein